jgi:hypothetical protein
MIAHASKHGSFFNSQLYQFTADLYEKMDAHRTDTFWQLPKANSKTATIHKVGQWVARKRIRYERVDMAAAKKDTAKDDDEADDDDDNSDDDDEGEESENESDSSSK